MHDMHLVLHGLAIKKHGGPEAVADLVALDLARVRSGLQQACSSGRAIEAQGKYALTPAGRMVLDGQYSRYYDGLRRDPAFVAAYERFELVNVELKQATTDWQTIEVGGERLRNDHSHADYDAEVIDRIGEVDERVDPILAALARGLPRIAGYRRKLRLALERAEDGDVSWISDARIDSYHTVWFELHEELLRVMGRVRDE